MSLLFLCLAILLVVGNLQIDWFKLNFFHPLHFLIFFVLCFLCVLSFYQGRSVVYCVILYHFTSFMSSFIHAPCTHIHMHLVPAASLQTMLFVLAFWPHYIYCMHALLTLNILSVHNNNYFDSERLRYYKSLHLYKNTIYVLLARAYANTEKFGIDQ